MTNTNSPFLSPFRVMRKENLDDVEDTAIAWTPQESTAINWAVTQMARSGVIHYVLDAEDSEVF